MQSRKCLRHQAPGTPALYTRNAGTFAKLPAFVSTCQMAELSENYSLWIKPSGSMAAKLSQEIATQANAFGGPLFQPHVTLLPDIPGGKEHAIEKSKQLAEKLKKFRINFLDVSSGQTFHRCVYLLAAQEAAIMQAGTTARQHFDMGPGDYMPHLSLLYADLADAAKADSVQQARQRLYGDSSNYDTLLTDNGFVAEAITLWYTPIEDRSLASWAQIGGISPARLIEDGSIQD